MSKVLTLILTALLIVSCATMRFVRDANIPLQGNLKGRISFIGSQLYNPVIQWNDQVVPWDNQSNFMNLKLTFRVPFEYPSVVLYSLLNTIPSGYLKNVSYQSFSGQDLTAYKTEMEKNGYLFSQYANNSDLPVIVDDITNYSAMDSIPLKYLNAKLNSDYYFLTWYSYPAYNIPPRHQRLDFNLTPKTTFAVYDKTGNKIWSKSYIKEYKNITENPYIIQTYYTYIDRLLKDHQTQIESDLSFLSNMEPAQGNTSLLNVLSNMLPPYPLNYYISVNVETNSSGY